MKCPSCGKSGATNYRCDSCGERRCANQCPGTTGEKSSPGVNGICKACKRGKYIKVG